MCLSEIGQAVEKGFYAKAIYLAEKEEYQKRSLYWDGPMKQILRASMNEEKTLPRQAQAGGQGRSPTEY
jgi:hypothetical protein